MSPPPKKKQMPVNMYHKSPLREGFAIRTKFPYVCFVSYLANREKEKLAYPKSDDIFGFINKKKSVLPKPIIVLRQCSCVSVSSLTKADWDPLLVLQ